MRENVGVGTILKYFAIFWLCILVVLTIASCIMYKDEIVNTVANSIWALINALMPIVLMIGGIIYMIRAAFK